MRWIFFVLLCFPACLLYSQQSPYNTQLIYEISERNPSSDDLNLLVEGDVSKLSLNNKVHIKYQLGRIASIQCKAQTLPELLSAGLIQRAELIPANKKPLNDTMYYRNRLKGVKVWTSPLPQAYDGTGVLMGIIDTGIDFSHPDFKDSLGKTRIRFLWDQTVAGSNNSPQPYNYGEEWTATAIDASLCTHSDAAYYGHGTAVSGIAAGNANATGKFEGVAPASDLIVVALDFNLSGPTVADAVHYIVSKATSLGKPFVINASLGDYYGSHDATDLEAKTIDLMIKNIPGRAMVAAVGNAGHIPFHVRTQVQTTDTAFTWIKSSSLQLEHSLYGDQAQVQQLQFSIGANRSNYSYLGNIGYNPYNYALNSIQTDTLKHNNNRIGIVESVASINTSGVYELNFHITADSSNLLWTIETTGQGLHDAWNFDFVLAPLPSTIQYPHITKYVKPDSSMNMVSSFQCSDEILTVGNYVNIRDFVALTGTVNTGEIAGQLSTESSAGPTRDQRPKPDVSATGNNVTAPMCLFWQTAYLQNFPQIVAQGSMHLQSGGSSAASPVVSGLVALYLQKNPSATNQDIISAIRTCAYQDNYTGFVMPHPRWGFGKLDGKASMLCNDPIVNGVQEMENKPATVYPNPFSNVLNVVLKEISGEILARMYDANGSLLFEQKLNASTNELILPSLLNNYRGLVFLQLSNSNVCFSFKLIKD